MKVFVCMGIFPAGSLHSTSCLVSANTSPLSHYITLPLTHYITSPHATIGPLAAVVSLTSITLQLLHYTWRCQPITSYCITLHYIAHSCGVNLPPLHYNCASPLHHIALHCITRSCGVNLPPIKPQSDSDFISPLVGRRCSSNRHLLIQTSYF